jgi:photosystem II stability/assembly factor-like uncharacterized protein
MFDNKKLAMQNINILRLFIFISILTLSPLCLLSQPTKSTFVDTNLIREGDEKFKIEREKWIQQMHRTEPGVNWRIIDNETRMSKQEARQKMIRSLLKNNEYIQNDEVEIAGGLLKGNWIEKGSDNLAGRIHTADIDFSRNLIYAASSGGNIWRGTLDGKNWFCLNNGFQISNIRMVKIIKIGSKNRIVVVGNGAHVYYSDDEGITWNDAAGLENPQKWGGFQRAVVTGGYFPQIYVLGNEWDWTNSKSITSIYMSNDYGQTFRQIYNSVLSTDLCDIWCDNYTNASVYFIHNDTLSSIDDYGIIDKINILLIQTDFSNFGRIYIQGSFYNSKKVLALFMFDKINGKYLVYRSTDRGQNWNEQGSLDFQPFEQNSMAVSKTNPDIMYFGGVELYKTSDGGVSWSKVNNWWDYYGKVDSLLHADIPGVNVFKNPSGSGDIVLISTDGGIYKSTDDASTVSNLSLSGLNVSQYYSTFTDRLNYDKVYAGSQDQGLQRCLSDSGAALAFEQVISGDYGHLSSADGGNSLWSVYPGFAQLYIDFNSKNTKRIAWDFVNSNHLWMPPLIEDPENPLSAYIAAGGANNEQNIWHLSCDSNQITTQPLPYDFNADSSNSVLSAIAISPLNLNTFYVSTGDGKFFYSSDDGVKWTKSDSFNGPGTHYFYGSSIVLSQKTYGRLYIAGSGYSNPGAYLSNDNGASFVPIDSGLPNTMIYSIAVTPDDEYIFAATEVGPYVYISSLNHWFDLMGNNTPEQTYWTVEYLPKLHTARFGTYGRGIWDFKITNYTDVSDKKIDLSDKLIIKAYPNPFINSTKILFSLPKETECTIQIFDLEGRIACTLNKGILYTGEHEFVWDGFSEAGTRLASGIYLCIVNAMGISNYCKLILK